MDLLLTNTASSPAKTPSSPCEGWDAGRANAPPREGTAPKEGRSFEALLGSCTEGREGSLLDAPQERQPLPTLGARGLVPPGQEAPVEGRSQEDPCIPERQPAGGESLLGLSDAEAVRSAGAQVSLDVEGAPAQAEEGSTSPSHRIGAQAEALRPEGSARAGEVEQGESAEGDPPAEGGGRARGEPQDAAPRILLSRMESMKAFEQTLEKVDGASKSDGQTGHGEASGSLAGKDGASWRQEVHMDPASRPAPPPVTSTHAMPAHSAQAASGTAFRVIGDAVHMRIQDEELGPMRWHIHLSGGRITAEAVVETSRVQQLLQNHQDVLEARLNAMGEEMASFDVSVDQGSQRFAAFSSPDGSGQAIRSNGQTPADVDPGHVVWNVKGNADRGLDLYV